MISKLQPVNLRELWKHEEYGFSAWLVENLDELFRQTGINLSEARREVRAGAFEVDIVAEDDTGKLVIVENQLEQTDHDHLGKVLTYLTNLQAQTAIWIAGEARQEHIRAISWLNETTPDDISFYLIKIAAYKIGDSFPAPMFTVLVRPSVEGKAIGNEKKELAKRHIQRLDFWNSLLLRAKTQGVKLHENRSATKNHWLSGSIGKTGLDLNYMVYTRGGAAIELYIDTSDQENNKRIFDLLFAKKVDIENAMQLSVDWLRLNEKRASRIRVVVSQKGLQEVEEWDSTQDAMIAAMELFSKTLKPFIQALKD